MKTCTVYGDLCDDITQERYQVVTLCDECVAMEAALGDDSQIISVQAYDGTSGDTCCNCHKTISEESLEQTRTPSP